MKDLIARRLADGEQILFEAEAIKIEGIDSEQPKIRFGTRYSAAHRLRLHRRLRRFSRHLPSGDRKSVLTIFDREYPFGWLGILADCQAGPTTN